MPKKGSMLEGSPSRGSLPKGNKPTSDRTRSAMEVDEGTLISTLQRQTYTGQFNFEEVIRGPWDGYTPDLNPQGLRFTAFRAANGVGNDGEMLVSQPGDMLYAVDKVTPPFLGDWPIGDNGAGLAAAPAGSPGSVVAIGQMINQSPALLGANIANRAGATVPAATAIPNPGLTHPFFATLPQVAGATKGHFFTADSASHLIDIPYAGGAVAATALNKHTAPADMRYYQFTACPWAGTQTGANLVQSGAVVFTNNVDQVYIWDPGFDNGAGAGVWTRWPGAIVPIDTTNAFWGDPLFPAANTLIAKSCELFAGRVVFLNTEQNGERHYNRIVWTRVASRLSSGEAFTAAIPGSGARDIQEFQGEGLKLLRIGERMVAYSTRDVALFEYTGIVDGPFKLIYVTNDRGLVGGNAVCRVDRDIHFGIFDDGWFLFSSNGKFIEVGLTESGHSKWKKVFYKLLEPNTGDAVHCILDTTRNKILITFPTRQDVAGQYLDTQWEYDLGTDTVWPWDTKALAYNVINISSISAGAFPTAVCHGDHLGKVYQHDTIVEQRSSNPGSLVRSFSTVYVSGQNPAKERNFHKIAVTGKVAQLGSATVTAQVGTPSGGVSLTVAEALSTFVRNIQNGALGGVRDTHHDIQVTITSTGEGLTQIHAITLEGTEAGPFKDAE